LQLQESNPNPLHPQPQPSLYTPNPNPKPQTPPSSDVKAALSRPFDALVISYDLFARASAELERRRFKVVVLDEAHCIKNTKVGGGACWGLSWVGVGGWGCVAWGGGVEGWG